MSRVGSSRVRRCSICHGSGRVGSTSFKSLGSGRVGSRFFKSHGSGQVGSKGFQISRASRVESSVFKMSRVGSGHDPRDTGHSRGRVTMTRELFSADPRVGPADLTRGSVLLQTYSCLPEGHSRDPRSRPTGPKLYYTILAASCLKASLVPIVRIPSAYHCVYENHHTRHC